jgi:hypothetical protein
VVPGAGATSGGGARATRCARADAGVLVNGILGRIAREAAV